MCGDGVDFPFHSLLSYQTRGNRRERETAERAKGKERLDITSYPLDPHQMGSGEECRGGPFPRLLLGTRTTSSCSRCRRRSNTRRITRSSTAIAATIRVSLLWVCLVTS
jgi:hypothetical protein